MEIHYWKEHSSMLEFFEFNFRDEKITRVFLPAYILEKEYKKLPVQVEAKELEQLFAIMNGAGEIGNPMGTPDMQAWIRANEVGHTSMSVGDIVFTGKKWFVTLSVGFAEIDWIKNPEVKQNANMEKTRP